MLSFALIIQLDYVRSAGAVGGQRGPLKQEKESLNLSKQIAVWWKVRGCI